MTSVDDLVEQYHLALQEMARANADLSAFEDGAKIVFSKQVIAAGDVAISKAEHIARASDQYAAARIILDAGRKSAEAARAEVEYLKTRFEAWRSKSSMAKARLASS